MRPYGRSNKFPLTWPFLPFRLLRMSLASCKVFRPFLAASSARALAASARARSWSAVCKHMADERTDPPRQMPPLLMDRAPPGYQQETCQHLQVRALQEALLGTLRGLMPLQLWWHLQAQLTLGQFQILLQEMKQLDSKPTCCSIFPFSRSFFTSSSFPLMSSLRSS